LKERSGFEVRPIIRDTDEAEFAEALRTADAVIHLAGVNRPKDPADFETVNADFTFRLCDRLAELERSIPIAFASSIQATLDNPYGSSKRSAELILTGHSDSLDAPVTIYRLPNVFGKWCRPNYNSVVATFCHNTARGLPVEINDPSAQVQLVYIDDVVEELTRFLEEPTAGTTFGNVSPVYTITVGQLISQIRAFVEVRESLVTEQVGVGFVRALYATYVSYLPPHKFSYELKKYADPRGVFVEMLKTKDSGQFSFFTAHPGITRGGHYHHSKTEKFLVIKGRARFRFRHILTEETRTLETSGDEPVVVDTIPGWAHEITNIGDDEMVVMLWANEVFDPERPDTVASQV
jgi:UDP-2-acetamido-2,6-beta-L-arabino-hexul-4-ose reductase